MGKLTFPSSMLNYFKQPLNLWNMPKSSILEDIEDFEYLIGHSKRNRSYHASLVNKDTRKILRYQNMVKAARSNYYLRYGKLPPEEEELLD